VLRRKLSYGSRSGGDESSLAVDAGLCEDTDSDGEVEGYVEPYVNPYVVMYDEIMEIEKQLYTYAEAFDECGANVRPSRSPRYVLISRDATGQCCPITGMMASAEHTDSGKFFKRLVLVHPDVRLMALGRTRADKKGLFGHGRTPIEMPWSSGVVIAPGAVYTKNLDVSPESPHAYLCTPGEHETVKDLVDSLISKYRGSHGDVRNYDMPSIWLQEYLNTMRTLRDSTHKAVVRQELSSKWYESVISPYGPYDRPFFDPIRLDYEKLYERGTEAYTRFLDEEGGREALEASCTPNRNVYVALVSYSCDATVCTWFNGGTIPKRGLPPLEPRYPVVPLLYEAGPVPALYDWSLTVGSVAAATAALAATAGALSGGGDEQDEETFFTMCKQGYEYAASTPVDAAYNGLCALGTMALFLWSVRDRTSAGNGHTPPHPGGQQLIRRSYSTESDN
jgi:hypothetical protein